MTTRLMMTLAGWTVACSQLAAMNFVVDSTCYEVEAGGRTARLVTCWAGRSVVDIPPQVCWQGTCHDVVAVEALAFAKCQTLREVSLPATCTQVGISAFAYCPALERIRVDAANAVFSDLDGVLYSKDRATLLCYPRARAAEAYAVADGVTAIGENAFAHCACLRRVHLPASVQQIGLSAFVGCHALEEVVAAGSIASIGNYAFYDCNRLVALELMAPLPPFADHAFSYATCQNGTLKIRSGQGTSTVLGRWSLCFLNIMHIE